MEEVLSQILSRLDSMDEGQKQIMRDLVEVKQEQAEMRQEQGTMREGLNSVKQNLTIVMNEQTEMRKEVAFYYGSLMKKLDETRMELSSEIKHVSTIQKQHQNVLGIINDNQN
ncbi:hypothetical protein [Rossellomorea aquimaris]|uniref:Uncharacterized protein n=1 Tax=Rossellomorea aquimaris TaxID=189382 RepID=A0A366EK18_9BACI|nr:hypothetical protein [Rossellomorea aquimaris]RBP02741.1 hypothetical protein DET59_11225 [Rossellomorea aquimaris]